MAKKDKKIHVRLPEELHKRLRVKVAYEDTTIQEYVEKVIRENLGTYRIQKKDKLQEEEQN